MRMKKVIVVGINPQYNYPGDIKKWGESNTYYASNLGASFVSRTIIKMFDADYVEDIENVKNYKDKYELCVLAFTNHATDWRDVSPYADFIEKLNIPTALFSLGIQDYTAKSGLVGPLHHSINRILKYVPKTTGYIGVRGFHTASLLYKEGYNNVIPIGCPTLFNGMSRNLSINKSEQFSRPLFVFHRTFSDISIELVKNVTMLGQDLFDEAVFTSNFPNDQLKIDETSLYSKHLYGKEMLDNIKTNGVFYADYDRWFNCIGSADFVFGPRLHGNIAGIVQGVPSLLTARDIRVKEIANFFKIPVVNYEDIGRQTLKDLYNSLDYSEFNALYPKRYDNFIGYLTKAGILKYYHKDENPCEINFSFDDLQEYRVSINQKIEIMYQRAQNLEKRVLKLERKKLSNKLPRFINKIKRLYKKQKT